MRETFLEVFLADFLLARIVSRALSSTRHWQGVQNCSLGQIKTGTLAAPSGHPPRTPCCSVPEQTQISQVFFFLILTIFKVFTEFVITLFLFYLLVFWSQGIWDLSSPTRDQLRSHTPCIGRQSRNHWPTREGLGCGFWVGDQQLLQNSH